MKRSFLRKRLSLFSKPFAGDGSGRLLTHIVASVMLGLISVSSAADFLPYYDTSAFTPKWIEPDSQELVDFHRIPEFSFINQDGETINENDVENKIYVANFFFSTCPGICPMIRSKLAKVQQHFIEDDSVSILSHSIRPATDTIAVLNTYAELNGVKSGKWHLLTGDKEALYNLARSAYFANEDLGNIKDLSDFLHTENLLLIDKNRHIRGIYNGLSTASVKNLITDIEALKAESEL